MLIIYLKSKHNKMIAFARGSQFIPSLGSLSLVKGIVREIPNDL